MTDKELAALVERFGDSECSWLSTARPDGGAHAAPIWHVWFEGRIYVVAMPTAVKVRNIQQDPRVVITHPDPLHVIIIEGDARLLTDMTERLRPFFKSKYDWDIATDTDYRAVIEITPTKIMTWGEEGAAHRRRWSGEKLKQLL
jgi:general stress protein 26